jgi:hypothetical protein
MSENGAEKRFPYLPDESVVDIESQLSTERQRLGAPTARSGKPSAA